MQSASNKSWSQEAQTLKKHLAGPTSGFLTFERKSMLLLAFKTALAAGLCYWLATLAHLADGYWGSISAIIVLQSNVGSTVTASRDRLIGTLIGAGFGAVFSLFGEGLWVYLLAVVAAMVTCSLLGLKNSARLAGVTVTILMLVHRTGSNWTMPMHRVIEVLLGIVIALGISTLVLPDKAKVRLQDGLAQEFLLMSSVFETVMQRFHGAPAEELKRLREELEKLAAANTALLDAARNEPSGGKASLEGLSLVHQFGHGMQELLHALELAGQAHAEGSSDGGRVDYETQLEPELGRLAANVRGGFTYMAGCIHRWRFDAEPEGIHIDEAVAALDAKLLAVRSHVLEFVQADVLRTYAVQLHLKQLARLLRASRLETCRAVGQGSQE